MSEGRRQRGSWVKNLPGKQLSRNHVSSFAGNQEAREVARSLKHSASQLVLSVIDCAIDAVVQWRINRPDLEKFMKADNDFDQLLASLGDILALPDEAEDFSYLRLPSAIDVSAIRRKARLSQTAFARRIGVPVATIRNWEQGRRSPQGPARVLLALLDRNPRIVEETLKG